MTRLLWNPLGPTISLGDMSVNLSAMQVRLMQQLGARPGEMVEYRKLDPTGTGWHVEAFRRLLGKLRLAFGREIADATLVKLDTMGLRWDGETTKAARIGPLMLTEPDGRPVTLAVAAHRWGRQGYRTILQGKASGYGLAVMVNPEGRFVIMSEEADGAAYMLRAGLGRAV